MVERKLLYRQDGFNINESSEDMAFKVAILFNNEVDLDELDYIVCNGENIKLTSK